MANVNFEIYDGKTFKDLCKEVVLRSQSKKDQLDTLISDIRSQITQPNDLQVFIPRIKELLEIGVKNDEQLTKLAAVLQRLESAQIEATGGEPTGLTDAEKEQLMKAKLRELEDLKEIKKEIDKPIDVK